MTGVWSGVGWTVGRLGGWRPAAWQSQGGLRVLVVAPHPDDEVGCGGTLLLHGLAGDEVHVAYVTDGRASRTGGLDPDQMAAQRKQEVAEVVPVLGLAGAHWLGLREREWTESELVPVLRDLLRQIAPDIVYAPSCVDFHPEHVRVAGCLAQALVGAGSSDLTLRVYQLQVPLTPLLVNRVAPIESVVRQLVAAMRLYQTQFGSIARCLRMKRYGARFYGLAGSAEEFWELDTAAYCRVHAASGTIAVDGRFSSVRARPFTDPLAYLQGLGARRALRNRSASS
jgi:LmbE family N-acetylglucosaminyl deacetylase